MRVKSGVKSKLVQADLWAVKCSLIRVPFFCCSDNFNYWNVQTYITKIKTKNSSDLFVNKITKISSKKNHFKDNLKPQKLWLVG